MFSPDIDGTDSEDEDSGFENNYFDELSFNELSSDDSMKINSDLHLWESQSSKITNDKVWEDAEVVFEKELEKLKRTELVQTVAYSDSELESNDKIYSTINSNSGLSDIQRHESFNDNHREDSSTGVDIEAIAKDCFESQKRYHDGIDVDDGDYEDDQSHTSIWNNNDSFDSTSTDEDLD